MNLVATFPPGHAEITVNGLHQWDRGRQLEIHSAELPAVIEVHFACAGMDEAVVRSCSPVGGVAVALIPDRCLEQSAPITAWIYEINGATSGKTTKKITLPVEARTRPSLAGDLPVDTSDKYTEAVAAMNAAVDSVKTGNVVAARALLANMAEGADKINFRWKSLNALAGVEYFRPKDEAYPAYELPGDRIDEYFPKNKICVLRRTAYGALPSPDDPGMAISDVGLCFRSDAPSLIAFCGEMYIVFSEVGHVLGFEDKGANPYYKIDIAVLE